MNIIPRKSFLHDQLGLLEKGVPVDVPDAVGAYLVEQGHATAADDGAAEAGKKVGGKRKPAAA